MPYTVFGRRPNRPKNDYGWDSVGGRKTKKAAMELAERYSRAGYRAVHVRSGKVVGSITSSGKWYESKKNPLNRKTKVIKKLKNAGDGLW